MTGGPSLGTATLRAVLDAGSLKASLQIVKGDISGFANAAGKDLERIGTSMGKVGASATRNLTLPIVAAGVAIVKVAADFERSMNRVSALSGATGTEFTKLRDQAKELGATTQFSASQAADAMAFLAQAGFKANEIFSALPATLNLAGAAQLDLGQSADIVSNILTGFQLPVDQLDRAVDVLTKSFTSANTDLTQLGQGFKFVGPVASSFGLSLEETAAALGLLSNAGIQASSAGTGLRRILTTLATEQDKLGISTFDAQGKLRPLGDVLEDLAARGLTATEVMEIFGDRGGPALNALLSQGSAALRTLTTDLENSAGSAARIQEVQLQGLMGELTQLKSAAEGLAIAFGDSGLLGSATGLVQGLTGLVRKFTDLDPAMQKGITGALLFTAAIGPVTSIAAGLIRNFGTLIVIIPKVGAALAALRVGGLLLGGPVGWLALAATGVGLLIAVLSGGGKDTLVSAAEEAAEALESGDADVLIASLEGMRDSVNTTAIPALDRLIAKLRETGEVTVEVAAQVNAFAQQADRARALAEERAALIAQLAVATARVADLRENQQPIVTEALDERRADIVARSPALAAKLEADGFFDINEVQEYTGALQEAEAEVGELTARLEALPNPTIALTPLPKPTPEPDPTPEPTPPPATDPKVSDVAQRVATMRVELAALQTEVDTGLEESGTLAERQLGVIDTAVRDLIRLGADDGVLTALLGERAGFETAVRERAAFIAPIFRAELFDAAIAAERDLIDNARENAERESAARVRREAAEREDSINKAPILRAIDLDDDINADIAEVTRLQDEAAADRVRREGRARTAALRAAYEAPIIAAAAFDEAVRDEQAEIDALRDQLAAERVTRDNRAAFLLRQRIAELQALGEGAPAFLTNAQEQTERAEFNIGQSVTLVQETLSGLIAQGAPVADLRTGLERLQAITHTTNAPIEDLANVLANVFNIAPDTVASILDLGAAIENLDATAAGFVGRVDEERIGEDALQAGFDYDPNAPRGRSPRAQRVLDLQEQLTAQDDGSPVLIAAFRELQQLAPRVAAEFTDLAKELLGASHAASLVVSSTRDLRADEDAAATPGDPATPAPFELPVISEFDGIGERFRKAAEIGGDTYKATVISAAQEFAGLVVDSAQTLAAIFSGEASVGQGIAGIGTIIGGIVSLFDPLIGGLITIGSQLLGGLFDAFAPGDRQRDQDAARAAGVSPRGAPSIEFNVNVQQSLSVQSLTAPADRAAVDGLLTETVNRILRVIETNVIPRVTRLEASA